MMYSLVNRPIVPISDSMLENIKKHLSPEERRKVDMRQSMLKAQIEERERQKEIKLSKILDKDTLMRFAYVPFVVANLAWDYADTILLTVQNMKIEETKKLCRAVRQLKNDYDRIRAPYEDPGHKETAENNMYVFEDGVKDLLKLYLANIEFDIRSEYPNLDRDYIYLLQAVYECHIVLQCIYEYVNIMTSKIEKIVGHKIGDVLPSELRRLDILVMAFVGDKPISKQFEKQQSTYAKSLANRMAMIELNETKDN